MTAHYRTAGWVLLGLTALWIFLGLWKSWGIALDFANFYDAGQKARAGEFAGLYDPSALIAGKKPLGHMTFFSAPLTSYFYSPMAGLPPRAALLVFKVVGTLSLIAALVLLYRRVLPLSGLDEEARAKFFLLFSATVLCFQPFWMIYRVGGQTTPMVLLLFVGGLIAALSNRMALAAVQCALAVLVKPAFAPAAILIFLLSDNRFRVTAINLGVASVVASLWLFGPDLHVQFLDLLRAETRKLLVPTMNSAPFSFIEPMLAGPGAYLSSGDAPALVRTVSAILRLGTAVLLLLGLRAALHSGLAPAARVWSVWSGGLLLSLVLSPVVWAHYLAFAFPAIAALIAFRAHFPVLARLHLGLIVALSLFQYPKVIERLGSGSDSIAALTAIGFLKSLPLLLLLLFLVLWRRAIMNALRDASWSGVRPSAADHIPSNPYPIR